MMAIINWIPPPSIENTPINNFKLTLPPKDPSLLYNVGLFYNFIESP